MATPVQELASMPSAVARKQSSTMEHVAPKHRTTTALGFLLFLAGWYAFSPLLPQAVKQFLWSVLH